jgi:hypothetical protein
LLCFEFFKLVVKDKTVDVAPFLIEPNPEKNKIEKISKK